MSVVRDLFIKACTVMFMVSNGTKDGGGGFPIDFLLEFSKITILRCLVAILGF